MTAYRTAPGLTSHASYVVPCQVAEIANGTYLEMCQIGSKVWPVGARKSSHYL